MAFTPAAAAARIVARARSRLPLWLADSSATMYVEQPLPISVVLIRTIMLVQPRPPTRNARPRPWTRLPSIRAHGKSAASARSPCEHPRESTRSDESHEDTALLPSRGAG